MELTIANNAHLDAWLSERIRAGRTVHAIKGDAPPGSTYSDGQPIVRPVNVAWRDGETGEIFWIEYDLGPNAEVTARAEENGMTERTPEGPHERTVGPETETEALKRELMEAHQRAGSTWHRTLQVLTAQAAEFDRLRADARRWQTVAPMFQGWSRRMDGTAHWVLHGGAIKPRARTVAEAVDAMALNASSSPK